MNTHFFVIPFAVSGDKADIPETVQPDGSISFPAGYGPDYALDPNVSPSAILVDRETFNGLMFDITSSLAALQVDFPQWVTSTDNGGTPYAYNNGAVVRYLPDGKLYSSIAAANTATPGSDPSKWIIFGSQWATTAQLNAEIARAIAAEASLAPIHSPAFTGTPQAPTPAPGASGDLLATCSYVIGAVAAETARAEAAEAALAPLHSAALTGTPSAPTANPGTANGQLANTAYADAAVAVERGRAIAAEAALAPINSPALIGNPTAPTPDPSSNDESLATTAFVKAQATVVVRYARISVPIGSSFALAAFSWNSAFPNACLSAVASCETNDSFASNATGNNIVAITMNAAQQVNTLPDQSGGSVRVDTDEGKIIHGSIVVNIIGVGN